jgi:hypothetical protein
MDLHPNMEEGRVTDKEAEILSALLDLSKDCAGQREGFTPMMFGGHNGSDHGIVATRMVAKGWVDRRHAGLDWNETKTYRARGSCRYRITAKGINALINHDLTRKVRDNLQKARDAKVDALKAKIMAKDDAAS